VPAARGWTPAPAAAAAPAAPRSFGVEDMTLLRAGDMPLHAAPRPALSTLAELAVATPDAAGTAVASAQPAMLFPLIEALDLPGGLLPRRMAEPEPMAAAAPPATPAAPPAAPLPAILAAAEIDLPLPELLRLLAGDPAETTDAFLALRRPPAADGATT
ncbi:hypothetical protein, partial [Falsiroseomonas selenitidurans]